MLVHTLRLCSSMLCIESSRRKVTRFFAVHFGIPRANNTGGGVPGAANMYMFAASRQRTRLGGGGQGFDLFGEHVLCGFYKGPFINSVTRDAAFFRPRFTPLPLRHARASLEFGRVTLFLAAVHLLSVYYGFASRWKFAVQKPCHARKSSQVSPPPHPCHA